VGTGLVVHDIVLEAGARVPRRVKAGEAAQRGSLGAAGGAVPLAGLADREERDRARASTGDSPNVTVSAQTTVAHD
jgi:hypothetical protein